MLTRSVVALPLVAVLLLTGCAAQNSVTQATPLPSDSDSPSASPSASPSPSPPPPAPSPTPTSPLTGLPEAMPGPVLVVKLDNTRNALPHAGLHRADIVYMEEVEYGMTRLAAVFSGDVPTRIGPVRSARITDIDLLAQYGSPAFAFSGVQRKMWPVIDESTLVDISPNKGAEGYARDRDRRAPYNYFLDGTVGISRAPEATVARDIGLRFDSEVPTGGFPVYGARAEWSAASANFVYDPAQGDFLVDLNDRPAMEEETGEQQRADTVVLQYVKQSESAFNDKGGGNTPHAETIGAGTGIVLRDGQSWDVTWMRPDAGSGTTFLRADRMPMTFKPGQTWFVLLDETRPAQIQISATPSPSTTP